MKRSQAILTKREAYRQERAPAFKSGCNANWLTEWFHPGSVSRKAQLLLRISIKPGTSDWEEWPQAVKHACGEPHLYRWTWMLNVADLCSSLYIIRPIGKDAPDNFSERVHFRSLPKIPVICSTIEQTLNCNAYSGCAILYDCHVYQSHFRKVSLRKNN